MTSRGAFSQIVTQGWRALPPRFLPFADAATPELPLPRLLRLSLFQVSVGMAIVLLTGTLNRVMIVELGTAAWIVSLMIALPLVLAPLRARLGFRSDHHRSALGWRRVPYLWFGTLLKFGGLAILPFALLVLTGQGHGPAWIGHAGAALALLLIGAGVHITQTAGLALAADLAPASAHPRVVALLYVMLLLGMVAASLAFGWLLADFSPMRLIQVIQSAAMVTVALNLIALWKQEARRSQPAANTATVRFRDAWRAYSSSGRNKRFLVAVALGTAGFSMQDVLLEPYGGEILHLGVGDTTTLTAFLAGGTLLAFALAARVLARGADPMRVSAAGATLGLFAFSAVIFAAPIESAMLFRCGTALIGFGGGLFAVGMLTAAMSFDRPGVGNGDNGLALGAWGSVQASAAGIAIAAGGALRDGINALAGDGALGTALVSPVVGYTAVYHLEIALLFAALVAVGPLVNRKSASTAAPDRPAHRFGLAEFPG
jgi:BCD family chlorophyll transporter-like MFS transporter